MKKYLLSIAALLLGLLAHSQEADDLGNYAELTVAARMDANPFFGSEPEFTLGNSSLYTLFTGSASEHFSWTLQNHWFSGNSFLGPYADPFDQFKGLGFSDATNFIDVLSVDLSFGSWTFTLGKQCITTDGHEYDADDWDIHTALATPLWNNFACYQWGGKVAWTTPSELSTFSLQMTTSPFGERPFSSGLWSWSAQWVGEYDWFLPTWSVSVLGRDGSEFGSAPHEYDFLISLGNQFLFNDWTVTLDWTNISDINTYEYGVMKGWTLHGDINYAISDKFDISLRGNWVYPAGNQTIQIGDMIMPYEMDPWWNLGAICEFYPLRDSRDLRLHAFVEYDQFLDAFSFCVGARYNLTFNLW